MGPWAHGSVCNCQDVAGKDREPGKLGNWEGAGGKEGQLGSTDGLGGRLNLPEREREALLQSSQSKTPQEYSTLVEQFLKRLSDSRKK